MDMNMKIVADSSADLKVLAGLPYCTVPLKILAGETEYVDDENLVIRDMVAGLKSYTGTSRSSCPSAGEWLAAFEDKEYVFCITITSGLSGSYNSAMVAKSEYESAYPGRKVYVVDSLSTAGEMVLIAEKISELAAQGLGFEEICTQVAEYQKHTRTLFMLGSLQNLARNGRVNPAVAKVAGVLGIRVVGKASEEGTLEQMHKCRGEKRGIQQLRDSMEDMGYRGGKVRMGHCLNEGGAAQLRELILARWPQAQIQIYPLGGLTSFYAEESGIIMGFEMEM